MSSHRTEGAVAADGRGIPPARRQASRTRRSPARTHRQALPLRTRTTRRSHPEETQAAAQGPHGRHPAAAVDRRTRRRRHRSRRTNLAPSTARSARAGLTRTISRGRARARPHILTSSCASIPPGLPFIAGALALALLGGATAGWALAIPFVVARRRFSSFSFAIPIGAAMPARRRCGAVARGWPGARGRAGDARRGAARDVAAGQHFSVADGRARQPRAGLGPRHAGQLQARAVSSGVPPRRGDRQRAQRNLDRSRRTDGGRAADRRHSGAPRRVPRRRRERKCTRATGSAS